MKPKNTGDCIARYGTISPVPEGGLIWKDAPSWVLPIKIPDEIKIFNVMGRQVFRIFANKDMHPSLNQAFTNLIAAGVQGELSTFDGCFNVRWVRGCPGVLSYHSWGIAIDFNAKENPLGSAGKFSTKLVDCFRSAGFYWGGNFKHRPDPMHFEWVDHSDKMKVPTP